MDRQQLLKRVDKAWMAFKASYTGLCDLCLVEHGVTGNWSVRDIIAHVTTWDEEALKHLPLILKGGKPPRYSVTYGGIDAFNAVMTERKNDFSLTKVLTQLDETHSQLIALIQSTPEDQFIRETRFRHRLRLDTYSHYPKHAEAIRKWRKQRSCHVTSGGGCAPPTSLSAGSSKSGGRLDPWSCSPTWKAYTSNLTSRVPPINIHATLECDLLFRAFSSMLAHSHISFEICKPNLRFEVV